MGVDFEVVSVMAILQQSPNAYTSCEFLSNTGDDSIALATEEAVVRILVVQTRKNQIVEGLPPTRSASSELLRGVAIATNFFIRSEALRLAFHSDEFLPVYHRWTRGSEAPTGAQLPLEFFCLSIPPITRFSPWLRLRS